MDPVFVTSRLRTRGRRFQFGDRIEKALEASLRIIGKPFGLRRLTVRRLTESCLRPQGLHHKLHALIIGVDDQARTHDYARASPTLHVARDETALALHHVFVGVRKHDNCIARNRPWAFAERDQIERAGGKFDIAKDLRRKLCPVLGEFPHHLVAGRIAVARFFAENFAVNAGALERTVVEGADSVTAADAALD